MKVPQKSPAADKKAILEKSSLYQEFLAEREEILKHKWLESEKAGYDIGFERALLDWIRNYRDKWRVQRARERMEREEDSASVSASKGRRTQG